MVDSGQAGFHSCCPWYNGSMSSEKTRLVYSTDQPLPKKEKPNEEPLQAALPPAQQRVIVKLDRKGRGGKTVTVIEGIQLQKKEREALLKQLKGRLGTGGTVSDAGIEIQGDHRDTVMAELEKRGYKPKRSGG
ncbi:MAG: translation initiation factor [Nitrospirales bacterium]|nr:translation initiation factor [Nitrospirales bacterium]